MDLSFSARSAVEAVVLKRHPLRVERPMTTSGLYNALKERKEQKRIKGDNLLAYTPRGRS